MDTPNFKIDRPDITDEQALKHKSFDAVLSRHAVLAKGAAVTKPWHFWAGGTAVVAAIVTTVVLLNNGPQNPEIIANAPLVEVVKSAVQPPLAGVDVPYQTFTVKAGKEQVITTPSGSVIHIPANAILDANGNQVNGDVEINYREFHDPADFFLSGIPMTYDSAEQQMHFESAGMFEILGTHQGQEVFVNENAPVIVDMVSRQPGNQFNIYQLDPITGQWAFIEKDTAGTPEVASNSTMAEVEAMLASKTPEQVEHTLNNMLNKLNGEIAALKSNNPTKPQAANPELFNLQIEVDEKEFPEIAEYRDVLFEITEENTDFKKEYADIVWDDVALSNDGKKYHLTFTKSTEEYTFITRPVLIGKSLDEATALFETKFKAATDKLIARQEEAHKRQKQLDYLFLQNDRNRLNANDAEAARLRALERANGTEGVIKRTFTVSGFGIWNSDCPLNLPQGRMFAAKFVKTEKAESEYPLESVFLVERGKNAMYTIYKDQFGTFTYDPKADNVMWGVDENDQLVLFSPEDFAAFNQNYAPSDSAHFTMRHITTKVSKPDDVRQLMGI